MKLNWRKIVYGALIVALSSCIGKSEINLDTNVTDDPFSTTPSNPNWQPPSDPIPSTSAFAKDKEEYRVLYWWLAEYKEGDVTIPKKTLDYDANEFISNEDSFRMWALFANRGRILPYVKTIQLDAQHFLLQNIDKGGQLHTKEIQADGSSYDFIDEVAAAWWYNSFDYSKNPHYHRAALINRALIYSIADMIMLDAEHEKGNYKRTDYIGGSLIKYAVPYFEGKKILPIAVQKAYEKLLLNMFERAETWKITAIFGDMESMAPVGMYYTAKALDDADLLKRAAARGEEIYNKMISGAGFEKHENGFDVIYQGIFMTFSSWLISVTQTDANAASLYQWLIPYVDRSCKLIDYLTIVEPQIINTSTNQVAITGPSHFNVANNGGPRSMIWNSGLKPFLAAAGYSDYCKPRLFNQSEIYYASFPLSKTTSQIKSDLGSFMSATNFINNGNSSSNYEWAINYSNPAAPNTGWRETHWGGDSSYGYSYSHYKPNFYAELMADQAANNNSTKYPFNYSTNFIETFEDINESQANKKPWFVVAKSSSLHAIFHVGGLGWRNSESSTIAGFGGGAISSVSTVGPVIMGRERGNQTQQFTLAEWKIWPTHHMAGADENGNYFGTARDRDLNRTVTKNGSTSVTAVATGIIGPSNNKTAPNGSITGNVNYQRSLTFHQTNGITVTSTLNTNQADQAKELYEIIPAYLYDDDINDIANHPEQKTVISFYKSGSWVTPTTALTTGVTAIRLMRFNAPLYIHFSSAKSMKLSPSEFIQNGHDHSHSRNIMIDLLNNNGSVVTLPSQVQITYTMDTTSP